MTRGVIRLYKQDRGFGFIVPSKDANLDDVFFHVKNCGDYCPDVGDPVEFDFNYDHQGRVRATVVRPALRAAAE